MLQVVSRPGRTRWLAYILDEFARMAGADFEIAVVRPGEESADAAVVRYDELPAQGVCVPDRSGAPPTGAVRWLGEDVFILPGSEAGEPGFALEYDPFWNAFVFLSRLEEYLCARDGRPTHSYSLRHPRGDKDTFAVPVVNALFRDLRACVGRWFPQLRFRDLPPGTVEYSHDVDYVAKTAQLRIKQTAFNVLNAARALPDARRAVGRLGRAWRFLVSRPSYWCFDYWKELEERHGARSVFYVYARAARRSPKTWLLDPSYDVARDERLRRALRGLVDGGWEVGLHGSFESAGNAALLAAEKGVLERALGREVVRTRQHWLCYDEERTPRIHEELFETDSTLGWNDRIGLRSGCACEYHPWDHARGRALRHLEVPQVVMDSNVYDYGAGRSGELLGQAEALVERALAVPGARVAVSWHQRTCSPDYRWHDGYAAIVGRTAGTWRPRRGPADAVPREGGEQWS